MATYSHNDIQISYLIHKSPFNFDLVLIQGARFGSEVWKTLLSDLALSEVDANGRILTLETTPSPLALLNLATTLGLDSIHGIGLDDGADMLLEARRQQPSLFARVLTFSQNAPKGHELVKTVKNFLESDEE